MRLAVEVLAKGNLGLVVKVLCDRAGRIRLQCVIRGTKRGGRLVLVERFLGTGEQRLELPEAFGLALFALTRLDDRGSELLGVFRRGIQLHDASDEGFGRRQRAGAKLGLRLIEPFTDLPRVDRRSNAIESIHGPLAVGIEEDGLLGRLERLFEMSDRKRVFGVPQVLLDLFGLAARAAPREAACGATPWPIQDATRDPPNPPRGAGA